MKLILLRHGETEDNYLGILQGHLPGKLSCKGIDQAKRAALRLKDENIDFIYSSDLARASDTAKEIAKHHPDAPVEYVKDLREIFLGGWQGKSIKELGLKQETAAEKIFPEDGETSQELFNRAASFLDRVFFKHHDDTVLLSGHSEINKAIIAVITGKGPDEINSIEHQHNTSISVFEIDKDKNHKIHIINCIKHLKD